MKLGEYMKIFIFHVNVNQCAINDASGGFLGLRFCVLQKNRFFRNDFRECDPNISNNFHIHKYYYYVTIGWEDSIFFCLSEVVSREKPKLYRQFTFFNDFTVANSLGGPERQKRFVEKVTHT